MSNRTLVKVIAYEDCISIKTISRERKSPHRFFISLDNLAQLEAQSAIIVKDINSFAALRRDVSANTLEILFTWLSGNENSLSGYTETVVLPYSGLTSFVWESLMCGRTTEWNVLSIDLSARKPKIVFKAGETLHAVVSNGVLRRKLVRALRDNLDLLGADQIIFYDDFLPYHFLFDEIRAGKTVRRGALVLHGQENMKKAYYSVHT